MEELKNDIKCEMRDSKVRPDRIYGFMLRVLDLLPVPVVEEPSAEPEPDPVIEEEVPKELEPVVEEPVVEEEAPKELEPVVEEEVPEESDGADDEAEVEEESAEAEVPVKKSKKSRR